MPGVPRGLVPVPVPVVMAGKDASEGRQMILSEILSHEFAHEAKTTRRMLERLPADKLDWRPHAKSFTAIGLASHIVGQGA